MFVIVRGLALGLICGGIANAAIELLLRAHIAESGGELARTAFGVILFAVPTAVVVGVRMYAEWPNIFALWGVPYTHWPPPPRRMLGILIVEVMVIAEVLVITRPSIVGILVAVVAGGVLWASPSLFVRASAKARGARRRTE